MSGFRCCAQAPTLRLSCIRMWSFGCGNQLKLTERRRLCDALIYQEV